MPALDYTRLARLYDEYCVFGGDVFFFVSQVAGCSEPVLELMAGTGRLSLPLLEAGAELTCLDSSPAMLAVLQRKLRGRGLRCGVVCADAREIPLGAKFGRVLLPFQGLSEALEEEDRCRVLRAARRSLSPSGRFVCTLHNPVIRRRTLDGSWHEVGVFDRPAGGSLELRIRARFDGRTGIVDGEQRLVLRRERCAVADEEILVPLRFSLPLPEDVVRAAEAEGLVLLQRWGDFDGGAWDEEASPVFVAAFGRGDGPPARRSVPR